MDQHVLSIEMRSLSKAVDRYLGESMPESARVATGGNAHIIVFLARNRDKDIYQHTIEQKFCITRSTASRVLALMEKKGLIIREPVPHDARLKRIVLTAKADDIVADLKANAERTERLLVEGLSPLERETLRQCIRRMRQNINEAQHEFEQHADSRAHAALAPDEEPENDDDMKEESK
ncbi:MULTISPECIES: MarR family winged helix-turn-helix transcriptional regulator [Bifidobacterium]|uniref:MarR family winged helix-turn-helix transcriptional regulator n=1 Tax=Bifidobacterium TaxID=1678 RepID=UPI001BDD8B6E|nr:MULTISPECIES: MarR family transcriptional regulator [Bifidobacterium]MBT1161031.1 MarR family transcriptional regulator [Bifidobacterium sp. SO1]MBW3078106.1 MarR family transcriptional regulator [Bifidobacterium simiiventris]